MKHEAQVGEIVSQEIDNLVSVLQRSKVPVFLQGTYSVDKDYPPTMITYTHDYTELGSQYNNDSFSVILTFEVNVYSNDIEQLYKKYSEAIKNLTEKGYEIINAGFDIPSGQPGWTGKHFEIQKTTYAKNK